MEAVNDNRTKLYRIRRKIDGKFLIQSPFYPEEYYGKGWNRCWNNTGAFWKTDESIRKHLLRLISWRVYDGHGLDRYDLRKGHYYNLYTWGTPIKLVKVQHDKLKLYEVVATDIAVHGENIMEARDFAAFSNDLRKQA